MRHNFDTSLEIGDIGETVIDRALKADRFLVKPHAKLPAENGHGPQIDDDLPFPDFEAKKHGTTANVEVKTKLELTYGRLSQEPEHGIDQSAWDRLHEYERRTGEPVFLVIVELFQAPDLADIDEARSMIKTVMYAKWMQAYFFAPTEERRLELLVALETKLRQVGGILCRRINLLTPRHSSLNDGTPMVYFPRSQLRGDWLTVLNEHIARQYRPGARAARLAEDRVRES